MKTLLDEAGKDFLEKTEEVVILEAEIQKAQVTRKSNFISLLVRHVLGENTNTLLTIANLAVVQRFIFLILFVAFLWLLTIILIVKWAYMIHYLKNKPRNVPKSCKVG